MKTIVYLSKDEEEFDDWPGCFSSVEYDGTLTIIDSENDNLIQESYAKGQWVSVTTEVDEN